MVTITIDDTEVENLKIAKLIKKYGLETRTIFFADFKIFNAKEIIKKESDMGFTIGSHTLTHYGLCELPEPLLKIELKHSKEEIEKLTGKPCKWFAYPYGQYNDKVVKMVEKVGYKYARTCKKVDNGNFELGSFGLNGKNFERSKKSELNICHIHYYNLEDSGNWDRFENFLKWLKDSEDLK